MKTHLDRVDACVKEMKTVAKKHGVILFRLEVGNSETLDTYKRIESWSKYCRRLTQSPVLPADVEVRWAGRKQQERTR